MPVRPLSPELAEKARVELNEDPQRVQADLQHLQDWLDKQPHIRAKRDEQWLIAFLRGCKYSLERTKEKLDLYYSLRTLAPELHSLTHKQPLFHEILGLKFQVILPKLSSPDAPRVTIMRPGAYDPNKVKIADVFSVANALQRVILMDDDVTVVSGVRTILDLEGVTMGHLLQMTPAFMKKMVVMGQDATPMRLKGTHYINTPTGFETVYNAIKGLLNEKNKNRLYVHNKNYEELYQYVPKDILPAEYGGNGGTIDEITDYWRNKVQEYGSWLDEDLKCGTDESKRPGQPKTAETLFGVEGSFRQLQFD